MCGIFGVKFLSEVHPEAMDFIEQLFLESQIRGIHASGFTFLATEADGSSRLKTEKAPGAALRLLSESELWKSCRSNPPRVLVGHTRYSTSGDWDENTNNQPLTTNRFALVHNGLVSMATPEEYGPQYDVPLKTANDSEVILKKIWKHKGNIVQAMRDIYEVEPPIFACGLMDFDGNLWAWADNVRPLWLFMVPEWNMLGFASTEDIIKRASKDLEIIVWKAKPFHLYDLGMDIRHPMPLGFTYPTHPRFERPNIIYKQWLRNKAMAKLHIPKYESGDCRQNPREAFKRYSVAAITSWEIDPNYPLLNYIFRRYELSKSQEYWACWLYGVFYHPGTLFWFMQEFPEYEKVDLGRLERWHAEHWKELRYNTDMKYNKGHFIEMFKSYMETIGSQTPWAQEEFFNNLLRYKDPVRDFHNVWNAAMQFHKFGRYTCYVYTEALHRCMGMPILADTVFLKEAKSSRNGLCYALDRLDLLDKTPNKETLAYLDSELESIMQELKEEYPDVPVDMWLMESCLCAFKGFYRTSKGRYTQYYTDRMAAEFLDLDGLPCTSGVYWNLLWQFRRECMWRDTLGEYQDPPIFSIDKSKEHVLRDTGRMIGLEPAINRGILPNTPIHA